MKINNNLLNNQLNAKTNMADKKVGNKNIEENGNKFNRLMDENIQLSQKAKAISETKESFNKVKVEELKKAILDGSYKVDSKQLAANIFNFEKLFGI